MVGPEAEASSDSGSQTEDDADEEFNGFEDPPIPVDHEAEYIDEDRYTTVTVEEMDLSKEGIYKAEQATQEQDSEEISDQINGTTPAENGNTGKKIWTRQKPVDGEKRPKKKKKKFRYESKAERKFTRAKERSKNSKQAKARREE